MTLSPVVDHVAPVLALDPRRDALRDLRTVLPGVVPFGIFLGMTVTLTGSGAAAGLLGAGLVYGGSAQLTTITVLSLGSGLVTAVAAGLVVNARILLYGAALAPWFRDQPRWFRLVGAQFLLDQTYLSAVARPAYGERPALFRRYWVWLGLTLLAVWLVAVGSGMALAPLVPDLPHLVLVGTAMFVALLVPKLVDRPSLASALVAATTAALVAQVVSNIAVLAGAAAGVACAVLVSRDGARS